MSELDFMGFRRRDGGIGIRNLMVVLSATDAANPVARSIAAQFPDAVAVTPPGGRGQLGDDLEQRIRTLVGLGCSPNVFAVLVVSLESVAGERIAESIARSGKPVELLSIQGEHGTQAVRRKGVEWLKVWQRERDRQRREPGSARELSIGLECGGSDATSGLVSNPAIGLVTNRIVDRGGIAIFSEPVECLGGEEVLRRRAKDSVVAERILATIHHYETIAMRAGVDLNRINPAPDNIKGGLSSIEEKSLGSICKSGARSISGVLAYGERPSGPGLFLMDAPAPATENITALAAAGAQVILFGTGMVNTIGSPIAPTIKICGNPNSCRTMGPHIDVDLGDVIDGTAGLDDAAEKIVRALSGVLNGEPTCCEVLGELEVAISRIGPSI
ncbi:MAG TPA: UxaA family hydrolase [Ramlibacter sp.]|uniref:UxaA family hydrolase n=1 Tax=Ramlibacter sp. TaxID=1917967 RepID=UPI002C236D1E|nr:UxaA family hydrolase [Ramlibacter sp.]HVZ45422.1 UxaA family hydrolase [Ramlibacter sp.]